MSTQPKVITLIGAGNSSHVCAGLIHSNTQGNWSVRLLTRNPQLWSNKNPTVTLQDGTVKQGKISVVSDDPALVIPGSDLVLWTGPVYSTRAVFQSIAPHVDVKRTVVATIFGQGLSHILAVRVFGPNVRYVALRNIPWLCRCTQKGASSEIVGAKSSIEAASINVDATWITENMQPLFITPHGPVINLMPDWSAIVFNPANQIIHPAAYWGLFRDYNFETPLKELKGGSPWLYRSMDEIAGQVLASLDEELQNIKNAYYQRTGMQGCNSVQPLHQRILRQYGDLVADGSTMGRAVATNKAYSMAKTPVLQVEGGIVPNPNHRVVQDDIGWGLCVLISVAERLRVPTTTMKWLVQWHQRLMKKEFLVNGQLTGKDVNDLVVLSPDEPLELVGNPSALPRAKM